MSFLHATILPMRVRTQLRNNRSKRGSVTYRDAKKVGILFTMNSLDDYESIRQFENRLKKDGKEVNVLSYLPKNVENFHFHYDIFSITDFSATGQVKAGNITNFLEQKFDYLICLDKEPNLYIEYILAASAARCRIGNYVENKESLFELMIRLNGNNSVNNLIQQIYHYTNKF
ncbi:hypothetical protein [Cesiribacter sp. SM1]|uniref:DUF6913 domain-containing protein n=1 Tax=Cesiribacter sp. SM1 TaxID=2861196 RepID=UPI001CD6D68C|nr:hypothetical protein [Cesiribacter sp. SM1]